MMTAPTLIIGLGGIGSDIVSMVEQKTRKNGIDTANIKFLMIDTDNIALCKHKESGFNGRTIRISQNVTVEACLDQNREAKEGWYPNTGIFRHKTLTDGAGQVRSISRLALEDAIVHKELQPLYSDIHSLHLTHHNPEGKTLRIAVVSSLAGGTGSGIILPFAVHLGDYLATTYPGNGYNMSGFFMMPDIVLMNNRSSAIERISLNSNAYATIKELDAFIQKNAGTKQNVAASIEMPEKSIREKEVSIYNFNFLFGILNNDPTNLTLNSVLQYEDMMADSVYMAFCSSINELNSTREDNKFKHLAIMLSLAEEKRYNTFGSIGVAVLQYPYYELRTYLTMLWAQDILKREWFQYDEAYEQDLREHIKRMDKGIETVGFIKKQDYYLDTIDTKNDPFSIQIRNELKDKETGEDTWKLYAKEVEQYIREKVIEEGEKKFAYYYNLQLMWLLNLKGLNGYRKCKHYQNEYYDRMRTLFSQQPQMIDSMQNRLREELYGEISPVTGIQRYHLDYWLRIQPDGDMKKPNAIRYFLGKVCEQLREDMKRYENEYNTRKSDLDALQNDVKSGSKMTKKTLISRIRGMRKLFEEYAVFSVSLGCVREGLRHVENLYSAYEELFEEYRKGMGQLEDKIQLQKKEMLDVTGTRRQVICCNDDILAAMHELMISLSSKYYGTLSGVSEQMYREVQEIVARKLKKRKKRQGLWEELLKYWEDIFEKTYGSEFNMDILSALEWEIKNIYEDAVNIKAEMELKINNSVDKLSAPFLKTDNNPDITTIEENYFDSSLNTLRGDKKSIVQDLLMAHNGVSGKLGIDKYTIYFYKSMFGVDADGLYPFREDGIYYRDYQLVTRYMHINDKRTEVLTPHIDRTWHRIDVLPELSQKKQDYEMVCQWEALLYGCIENTRIYHHNDEYIISSANVKSFRCGNLFQVMDIIRDFKEVREDIRSDILTRFKEEKNGNLDYLNGEFYKKYLTTNVVSEIFVKYMDFFDQKAKADETEWETECFLTAWERILTAYLSVYSQADPKTVCSIIEQTIQMAVLTKKEKARNKDALDSFVIAVNKKYNISVSL